MSRSENSVALWYLRGVSLSVLEARQLGSTYFFVSASSWLLACSAIAVSFSEAFASIELMSNKYARNVGSSDMLEQRAKVGDRL
jgi:hypothetical protein